MTHDELLARIKQYSDWAEVAFDTSPTNALRAVVELHKPDTFNIHGQTVSVCPECNSEYCWSDDEGQYPCPTIQAIEKELK